jgi:hypothetical protein
MEAKGQSKAAPKKSQKDRLKEMVETAKELGIKLPGIYYSDKGDGQ